MTVIGRERFTRELCHIPNCHEPAAGDCDPCGKPTCTTHITFPGLPNTAGVETYQCAMCAGTVNDKGEEAVDAYEVRRNVERMRP